KRPETKHYTKLDRAKSESRPTTCLKEPTVVGRKLTSE
ncbi:unnamed protein product, partial [Brassica rapa subsp. trilocularis]